MAKYKVTMPDIDDNCKNGTCDHEHVKIVSNEKEQPKVELIENTQQPQQLQYAPPPATQHNHNHQEPEPKQLSHKEMSELMPTGINFSKCKGEDCGKPLKNNVLTKNFKKCTNCNSNTVPKNKKYCPTCGMDEPQDEDEREDFWEESDIDTDKLDSMLDSLSSDE